MIFPKEILESMSIVHQSKIQPHSRFIYLILLIFLLGTFVALPFLTVKIYTSSTGLIKPDRERTAIAGVQSGKVLLSNLKNNRFVKSGDTLLMLDDAVLDEQKQFASYRLEMSAQNKKDLKYLIQARIIRLDSLQTPKYQKEYLQFSEKLNELQTRFKKAKNDFDRNKILFDKKVIAKAEFEKLEFDYNLALNSIYQLKEQQRNTWQASLSELEMQLEEIENNQRQLTENQNQFVITAPVSGTLLNVLGIERGSYINAGTVVAEISPDTDLIAECYVNPVDIGLIRKDKKVNFQIDAFNYNLWGLATGEIIEISDDIEMIDNQPVFKVRCIIHQTHLKLKNGTVGKLGKGMMLRARFELTERSLFDLLYDKMDDWLNPANSQTAQN